MPRRIAALATAGLALACVPAAAAASTPPAQRPHARLATYLRHGIEVQRLQATLHGTRVRVRVAVHNDLHLVDRVALRVATCPSTRSRARCTPAHTVTLRVPSARTRSLDRTFAIRADRAVDVAVTPLRIDTPRRARQSYADLLVGPRRGTWGLAPLAAHDGTSIGRLSVLMSGTSSTSARVSVAWTGRAAVASTLTTSLAGHPIGDPTTLAAGATGSFFDRPSIQRPGATVPATVTDASGAELASVLLPFPRRD
jgi:hypothetical protein